MKARGFHVDPDKSVGYLLREASRRMLRELQGLIGQYDVTLGHFFIMRELWITDGVTQRELSHRIGLFENSTNAALDAMEKRGLIGRRRSTEDRRKVHIWLSARGRQLREELLLHTVAVNERALTGFTIAEIDTLRKMLRRVRDNMSAE